MALSKPRMDKHICLMNCLAKSCTKVVKALVLHYLPLAKPSDIEEQEWNMDDFLYYHRDGGILQNFIQDGYRKNVLFPGRIKHTNTNKWDLATLFTVLGLFQNVDIDIKADKENMRKLRNKLFHWGSDEMEDSEFDKNRIMIEKFVDNCCRVIGNETIKDEVKVILEEKEELKSIEKALHTELEIWKKDDILDKLDKLEPAILTTFEELYMKVTEVCRMKDIQIPEINLTLDVKNCSNETSSKVTEVLYQNIIGSTAECDPKDKKIRDAINEAKEKLLRDGRSLRETYKACVILTIQCPEFNSLKSLIEECLTGKLTATWNSVENILRKQYKNEQLSLEFTITNSEFWCCIEELVEILTTTVKEKIGVDISPVLPPAITVHPPTSRVDSEESGTRVSAVPITIKPNSHRHAIEVSNAIKNSKLNEDLQKISTLIRNGYGIPDMTITAYLGTTETHSDDMNHENTPMIEHGPSPPKKFKCVASTLADHVGDINNSQSVTH